MKKKSSKSSSLSDESSEKDESSYSESLASENPENISTEPNSQAENNVSYRSLVYMVLWGLLISWQFLFGMIFISRQFIVLQREVDHKRETFQTLQTFNYTFGLFGAFIMGPLPLIFPPIFKKKRSRIYVKLFLLSINIICFAIHFITGLCWAFLAPTRKLLRLLTVLVLEEYASAVVLTGLMFKLIQVIARLRRGHIKHKPTGKGFTVDLMIFFGCVTVLCMESALFGTAKYHSHIKDSNKLERGKSFDYLIPIHNLCWLFLLYQQHYLRKHIGWYTYARCRAKVEDELRIMGMDPLQVDMYKNKAFGTRVIEGSLQTRLFKKNLCPC